ncbi:MAG: hypothetical protein Q7R88_01305 [bacterium]|nr:hypothetical protein [bacterium]
MSVLFALKAQELSGTETALLRKLRRADPVVEQGWKKIEAHMSVSFDEVCRRGYGLCKEKLQVLGVSAHARLHRTSLRFGEYLKKQGVAVSKNPESASGYMQDMLEYKKTVQEKPESTTSGTN